MVEFFIEIKIIYQDGDYKLRKS